MIRVAPDFAVVTLSVNRTATKPSEAFRQAKEATAAVRAFARAAGVADEDVQSSQLTLATVHIHVAGRELAGAHLTRSAQPIWRPRRDGVDERPSWPPPTSVIGSWR